MLAKQYYLTNLAVWRRHAPRCAETHFIAVAAQNSESTAPGPDSDGEEVVPGARLALPGRPEGRSYDGASSSPLILALVTADEAAQIALENDADVEALPHPLSRTPISERAAAALAPFGVAAGDDTFTVAEKLARINPLLRHRLF